MTLKDMMKKVETYNEIADLMGTQKAEIAFVDYPRSERFKTYSELRRYIRQEYVKSLAELILNDSTWEMNEPTTLIWKDAFSIEHVKQFYTMLVKE